MKASYIFGLLAATLVRTTLAAPAPVAEPIADAAPAPIAAQPLEKRTFFYPGYSKPWKLKIYAPGKSYHGKYLCQKDDGYGGYKLGIAVNIDIEFKFYLDKGIWPGGSYGAYPWKNPKGYGQLYLDGPQGYYDLKPWYGGGYPQPKPGYGGSVPWGYSCGKWYVWPIIPLLDNIFDWIGWSKTYWFQYAWQDYYPWGSYGGSNGWSYIGYDDGNGGYDFKYWDGKYKPEKEYSVVKFQLVKDF